MTREEAIQVLRDWDGCFIGHRSDDVNEALNTAIKALEQEPTTKNDLGVDCVSRQVISDYVESHIQEINTGYGDLNRHTNSILRMIVDYIENMPSVTPQEPKSEWQQDHEILKAYSDGASEVLDNIRAEIKGKIEQEEFARSVFRHEEKDTAKVEQCTGSIFAYNNVIRLIDKYKAESEDKE